MNEKRKPCPHCGEEPYKTARSEIWRCSNYKGRCPLAIANVDFTLEQWNRSFVCHDKDGKKVFAGDEVSFILTGQKSRKRGGTYYDAELFCWMMKFGVRSGKSRWISHTPLNLCEDITLIESKVKP